MSYSPGAFEETYYLHHHIPLTHGGHERDVDGLVSLILPPVDLQAARQPVTPGLPPLRHVPLLPPAAYKLILPQVGEEHTEQRESRLASQRIKFPVARPPAFQRTPVRSPSTAFPVPGTDDDTSRGGAAPSQPAAQASKPTIPSVAALGQRFDPLYPFLLFVALAFGTLYMNLDLTSRYTVLWGALIVMGVLFTLVDAGAPSTTVSSVGLGWGISFGLVFGLPLLILVSGGLAGMSRVLFMNVRPALLFQSLAIVGPLGETLFFRGALQERRGITASVVGAGFAGLLLYWPAASTSPTYLIAAGLFSTVLAGVYSFVKERHGIAAALICQVTVNLMLLFVPTLLT